MSERKVKGPACEARPYFFHGRSFGDVCGAWFRSAIFWVSWFPAVVREVGKVVAVGAPSGFGFVEYFNFDASATESFYLGSASATTAFFDFFAFEFGHTLPFLSLEFFFLKFHRCCLTRGATKNFFVRQH